LTAFTIKYKLTFVMKVTKYDICPGIAEHRQTSGPVKIKLYSTSILYALYILYISLYFAYNVNTLLTGFILRGLPQLHIYTFKLRMIRE